MTAIKHRLTLFLPLLLRVQALSIYHNRELITVFHGQQDGLYDFDTVLLKALVRGMCTGDLKTQTYIVKRKCLYGDTGASQPVSGSATFTSRRVTLLSFFYFFFCVKLVNVCPAMPVSTPKS